MATRGTDQCQDSHERRRTLIDTDIADGRIWVIHDRDRLVATVSVDELADADFWTRDDGPKRAVYVHRMAVARSHTGLQLGSAMLDWSADIAREQRRELVRFDAWATNHDLHQHYKSLDFDMVRCVDAPWRGSVALFERKAGRRSGGPRLVPADRHALSLINRRRG